MKYVLHRKTLRDDLILETCGQSSHTGGCYIRFSNNKIHHSKSRGDDNDVIVDYDINGNIVGIEFYNGLHKYKKKS